jgi:hypothetical protein
MPGRLQRRLLRRAHDRGVAADPALQLARRLRLGWRRVLRRGRAHGPRQLQHQLPGLDLRLALHDESQRGAREGRRRHLDCLRRRHQHQQRGPVTAQAQRGASPARRRLPSAPHGRCRGSLLSAKLHPRRLPGRAQPRHLRRLPVQQQHRRRPAHAPGSRHA